MWEKIDSDVISSDIKKSLWKYTNIPDKGLKGKSLTQTKLINSNSEKFASMVLHRM